MWVSGGNQPFGCTDEEVKMNGPVKLVFNSETKHYTLHKAGCQKLAFASSPGVSYPSTLKAVLAVGVPVHVCIPCDDAGKAVR